MKNYYLKEELQRTSIFEVEAKAFFNKYFDLTGKEFSAFNRSEWHSLDEWLADLKLAVYREEAIQEIREEAEGNYCKAAILFPSAVC